jgi:hypothetical protein
MKRILSLFLIAAVASLALAAGVQASQHARPKSAKTAVAAPAKVSTVAAMNAYGCPVGSTQCSGHCPFGGGGAKATSASASTAKYSYNGTACPVSDPSQCPSSCSRASATTASAVPAPAANVVAVKTSNK